MANSPDYTAQNRDKQLLYQVCNIMKSLNVMIAVSIWYCDNFNTVFLKHLERRHLPSTGSVMWQGWYGKYGALTPFLFGPAHTPQTAVSLGDKTNWTLLQNRQTGGRLTFQLSGPPLQFWILKSIITLALALITEGVGAYDTEYRVE